MADIDITDELDAVETYTTETPAAAAPKAPRAPLSIPGAAVGRRKEAIARVRIVPGTGVAKVNGRDLAEYFPNKLHQQLINDPFKVLDLLGAYDVTARITGGRPLGPGRCAAPRDRPRAQRDRPGQQPRRPQEGRLPHP